MRADSLPRRARPPAHVDWAEMRRRQEEARAAFERALNPPPEEARRILRQRAREAAREPAPPLTEGTIQVVTFLLAQETYAIEARFVREIYPLRELTPFPSLPGFVLGLIGVRGKVLPVVDIKKLFDLPEKGLTDLNKVLVVHSGDLELGILADQILDLRSVPLGGIQPSLPTLAGIREEYLRGVTAERMVILDAEKILTGTGVAASGPARN